VGLKGFHREMEKFNARAILEDRDEQLWKDVEFLLRSCILLWDIGKPGDWRLQLEAALAILEKPV
jgi:hypothetical protein